MATGPSAPWVLPVPTTSAAPCLQAASAALGTNGAVVSLLSGFISSHLVSSFRSDLSFHPLLKAACVCPAVRGYVCFLARPCHADPLVQPRGFRVSLAPKLLGDVFCIGWSESVLVVSLGGEVGSRPDPAIASAVPNCPFAFLMPWRGSHALLRCLCTWLWTSCGRFVALVVLVRNKGPPKLLGEWM